MDMRTVHDAVQAAVLDSSADLEMVVVSAKMPKEIKESAAFLCERHGITLSAFVRYCCTHLVTDYMGMIEKQ